MKKSILGIIALVALVITASAVMADPVGGSSSNLDVAAPDTAYLYTVRFYGNEWARVRVVGDGDTDLDVYVLDEYGNLIGSDTDYSDICEVVWLPRRTGRFTIRVVNLGGTSNLYRITVD